MNSWPFALVEHVELDARLVAYLAAQAIERVDLAHERALADACERERGRSASEGAG